MAKDEEKRPFDKVVEAIDSSESDPDRILSAQLNRSVREAIVSAQNSGQAANVVLKIMIKPGPERRMNFAGSVTAKLPRPPVSAVTLYADSAGDVHDSDPAQLKMFQHSPQGS